MDKILKRDKDALRTLNLYYLSNFLKYSGQIFDKDIIEIIVDFLPEDYKRTLIARMISFAKNNRIDVKYVDESFLGKTESEDETLSSLLENKYIRRHFQKRIIGQMVSLTAAASGWKDAPLYKRAKEAGLLFGLGELDVEILILIYVIHTNETTDQITEAINHFFGTKYILSPYSKDVNTHVIAVMLGAVYNHVKQRLQQNSALKKYGILDENNDINEQIVFFLNGDTDKPLLQNFYNEFNGATLALNDFDLPQRDLRVLTMLYKNRKAGEHVNILLHGEAGTGKTEFARAFAKTMSKHVYEISNETNEDNYRRRRSDNRAIALKACQSMTDNTEAVIIIDEADSMLNTRSFFGSSDSEKGAINRLLDQSNSFNIWITNYIDGMDESTMRRFDYAIHFEPFSFSQRLRVWKNLVQKAGLQDYLDKDALLRLADNYRINAAGISMALKHAKAAQNKQTDRQDFFVLLESFLESHIRLLTGNQPAENVKSSYAENYSLDGLNIKGDLPVVMKTLYRFNRAYEHKRTNDFPLRNVNLLLYGPPGTGKTEFAKYVARTLKRPLHIKSAAELLSMWVGQSEKNIALAFRQAERDRAILLLDEIDSFLFSRQGASHQWELSQVNELLSRMERFKGIFIACTNMKTLLDSAALRRFNFKMLFDYLTPEGNVRFYQKVLQPLLSARLTKRQKERLKQIKMLTPGDFRNIFQQHVLLSANELSHQRLITALEYEVRNKNEKVKRIGF